MSLMTEYWQKYLLYQNVYLSRNASFKVEFIVEHSDFGVYIMVVDFIIKWKI